MKHTVCLYGLVLFSVLCLISAVAVEVNTTSGPVRGETVQLPTNKTAVRFLGIRFAQASRFEAPIPPKPWNKTLNATSYGKSCPQNVNLEVKSTENMSEDCLFLNVYLPSRSTSNSLLPVMVWIYGGGYTVGSTGSFYDGVFIATEGEVVVVTVNYRLGILGFLSTGGDGIKGNLGLLDQLEALRWVKKNIGRWGMIVFYNAEGRGGCGREGGGGGVRQGGNYNLLFLPPSPPKLFSQEENI